MRISLQKMISLQLESNFLIFVSRGCFSIDLFVSNRNRLGFNNVRVNFNHIMIENMKETPVTCCSASGWKIFDNLLQWCEEAGVYVIFDLHSTPGGQSDTFVNDPDDDKSAHIWSNESNAARTEEIWRQIAERYADREIVLGV
jgi:endoglucanase